MRNQQQGFTMVEVMIVVVILAIVMAVGYPSYNAYATRAKRSDAISMLSSAAGEQFRFFTENNRYAADMTELGYPNAVVLSENGLYQISVAASGPDNFTLDATPVAGESQASDAECATFSINSAGAKTVSGTAAAQDCW